MCVSSCLAGWLSMYLSMCVSKYPGTQFLLFSLFSFQKTLIELIEGMLRVVREQLPPRVPGLWGVCSVGSGARARSWSFGL